MASSPIRINEATLEELQRLPQIGPKRAERIIRYREEVSPLAGYRDLAAVTGISEATAKDTARNIDWSSRSRPMLANLIFATCAGIACASLYHYAFAGYDASAAGPAANLYSISVVLILIGSLAMIVRQFITNLAVKLVGPGWIALICLASGLALLASLLVALLGVGRHDEFTFHIAATGELILFVAIIVSLIYGPGWHVRTASNHFDLAAGLFDHSQLILGVATLALLLVRKTPSLIELLFGIWVGVTVLLNGREMVRGRSSYVGNLSDSEKARLAFLAGADTAGSPETGATRMTRPLGFTLAALGATLIAVTIETLILSH